MYGEGIPSLDRLQKSIVVSFNLYQSLCICIYVNLLKRDFNFVVISICGFINIFLMEKAYTTGLLYSLTLWNFNYDELGNI